jgi:hypothetical protein
MGISFIMDYWYELVKSYDDYKNKDPTKRDDGTYSQFSVVMLLIYLAFGKDYSTHIATYFSELKDTWLKKIKRSSVLRHKTRIGTLLKKMVEDELVIAIPKESGRENYYEINPKIIQSTVRDGTDSRRDVSTFEIPREMVERFLLWSTESNEEDKSRDRTFKNSLSPDTVDYFTFLFFLETEAVRWHIWMALEHDPFARKWDPTLYKLVSEYIKELKELPNSNFDPYVEHRLRTMPHDLTIAQTNEASCLNARRPGTL